jgi:hypothetical protein
VNTNTQYFQNIVSFLTQAMEAIDICAISTRGGDR